MSASARPLAGTNVASVDRKAQWRSPLGQPAALVLSCWSSYSRPCVLDRAPSCYRRNSRSGDPPRQNIQQEPISPCEPGETLRPNYPISGNDENCHQKKNAPDQNAVNFVGDSFNLIVHAVASNCQHNHHQKTNCAKSFVTREGVERDLKRYVVPKVGLPW